MDGLQIDRHEDGVVVMTINRPERRNALDDPLLLEILPAAFTDLAANHEARVVVLTGASGAFCAGADLECTGLEQPSALASHRFMTRSHQTVQAMRRAPQPIIAAVDGAAVGAGLGLAVASDIRIASPRAAFIAPFLKMGLPPDYGSSYFLPRVIGAERALEMFLTSRVVKGEEALAMGLVSRLSEQPLEDALELARIVATNPAHAVGQTKRNVYSGLDTAMSDAVENEVRSVAVALHSEEFAEAFTAWRTQIRGS
jgi:enoyl-CoA hydratase/carnithine racemase